MRVSADYQIVFPCSVEFGFHTFALLSVCTILSVIVTALVLHLAVTVCWASGSAAIVVVSIVTAAVVLARGVVATSGGGRPSAAAWWCAVAAASVRARFRWTVAASIETPRSRGRCTRPLSEC